MSETMNEGKMDFGDSLMDQSVTPKENVKKDSKSGFDIGQVFGEVMENKKSRYAVYGGFSILALFLIADTMFKDVEPKAKAVSPKEAISQNVMSGANYREMTLEKMTARLEEMNNELKKTQRDLDAAKAEADKKSTMTNNGAIQDLVKQMEDMKKNQAALEQEYQNNVLQMKDELEKTLLEKEAAMMVNQGAQGNDSSLNNQAIDPFANRQASPTVSADGKPVEAKATPTIVAPRDIDETTSADKPAESDLIKKEAEKTLEKAKQQAKENEERKAFLPAGSMISGTLLTGMFAPTGGQARQDPFPVLMRVKHEALLPNKFNMDIRECFMIGSGYGDLSSERALLRAEVLSCVNDDGVAFEVPLDAYASGPDGKAGMPGKLISRNGSMIAKSLMAGFISGMADSMRPKRIQGLIYDRDAFDGSGGYETPDPGSVMTSGTFKGTSMALNRIAEYYIELAEQAFPVIEINAGTKIDFIVKRGVNIRSNTK